MKFSRLIVPVVILLLSACSGGEPGVPAMSLDYSQLGKISLDVQDINVVDRGSAGSAAQSVPLKPSIDEAVRRWASDRLQATGSAGQVVVIIKDANIGTQSLRTDSGFDSWFERQQGSKYVGHVDVEIEARGHGAYAIANAQATHEVSLPENPSEVERYEAYRKLLESLMSELNRNLDQAIHEHLQDFMGGGAMGSPVAPTGGSISTMPLQGSPN